MASGVRVKPVTREKLAKVFRDHELIKLIEGLTNMANFSSEFTGSSFILTDSTPEAPNGRSLRAGPSLRIADNGAGSTLVIDMAFPEQVVVLDASVSERENLFADAGNLFISMEASATYQIEGVFLFQSQANVPTIGLGFTAPLGATVTGLYGFHSDTDLLTGPASATTSIAAGGVPSVTTGCWLIRNGATAGPAQLRFRTMIQGYSVTLNAQRCTLFAKRIE